MGEPIVIVPEDGGGDQGVALAAGAATVVAENASETADEALGTAEMAEAIAEGAQETAWDARSAVDALRGEVMGALDEIRAGVAGTAAAVAAEVVEEASPPEPADSELSPPPAEKPKRETKDSQGDSDKSARKWGSDIWFGNR